MQHTLLSRQVSSQFRTESRPSQSTANYPYQLAQENRANHQFIEMLNAYRCIGGLARAKEVFFMFQSCKETDVTVLARWLVKKEIISFEWQSKIWIPLFQFDCANMTTQPGLSAVLMELISIYDPWELAYWFIQPNPWLEQCTPASRLALDAATVLNAARVDRYINT
jgi:hypothetical protein